MMEQGVLFSRNLLFSIGIFFSHTLHANNVPLVFFNWADYMSPEILAEFEQISGIQVKEIYYDSDEGRDEVLALKNGKGFDLILTSGLSLKTYVKQAWLAPFPDVLPQSLLHIDDIWRQSYPESKQYAVPYFWGTLGVAYRQDLVSSPINSWNDFFELGQNEKGSINFINSSREVFGAALKAKGHSLNSEVNGELDAAFNLLERVAPNVASFNYVDLDETSSLVSGDIKAAMMYSGDALVLQEHNEDIAYILPSEGSNIWVDFITISSSSKQKEAALAFIAFLNRPNVAARLAEYVYYASPNKAARALLDQDFLQNNLVYPDAGSLENSEFFHELPARTLRRYNQKFQQLID